MADHRDSDSDESVPFFVDLKAHVRDDVSISSVDSEPIAPRMGRLGADNEFASSADDDVASLGDDELGDGTAAARLPVRPREVHSVSALGVNTQELVDQVAEADRKVPVERLSEAPVAQVSSISAHQRTLVAEGCDETVALDVGTHLCLPDGTLVGVVASTFGPVKRAFYILGSPLSTETLSQLQSDELLGEETGLHMDLGHQAIIFDPMMQCDVMHGTDASYINDEELPEYVRPDFSDDEKELSWKRQRRLKRSRSESISSDDAPEDIEWSHIELEDPVPPPPPPPPPAEPILPTPVQSAPATDGATGIIVPKWLQK